MADILCGYTADRDETLIAFLYGEIDPVQRAAFEAHLATCERCRRELTDLRDARADLQKWTMPEARPSIVHEMLPARPVAPANQGTARKAGARMRIRDIPAWAQVAAAVLVLGVSAGLANLDIRFDRGGLSVRTGWSRSVDRQGPERRAGAGLSESVQSASAVAWRADFDALERRLRTEFHNVPGANTAASLAIRDAASSQSGDSQVLRRMHALIEESERKQNNELALRIADVVREFDTRRGADLVNIDRSLRTIQSSTGIEVARQQQMLNYLTRVSLQK